MQKHLMSSFLLYSVLNIFTFVSFKINVIKTIFHRICSFCHYFTDVSICDSVFDFYQLDTDFPFGKISYL